MEKKACGHPPQRGCGARRFKHYMCLASDCVHAEHPFTMFSMGVFHFSDEALKGARKRRGKPRLDQHMRSNLEALQRSPPTKEAIK